MYRKEIRKLWCGLPRHLDIGHETIYTRVNIVFWLHKYRERNENDALNEVGYINLLQ